MKKHRRIVPAFPGFLLLCLLPFLGAAKCNNNGTGAVELTLFHTNDLHSHFRAAKTDPFGLGGLARMATLLKRLRGEAPVSLTLDAGDYSEGAWYFAVDTGANMLKAMGMLGFDAAALGNHDFLIGPDQVIRTMNDAGRPFPVLAANLDTSAYARAQEFREAVPSSVIKTVGGLKVGIIGLTTFELIYDSYIAPIKITNLIDVATQKARELSPQVDVLLVVSHNGFDVNAQVARSVPGIHAVISGHSHRKRSQALLVKNAGRDVPVVETGQWGAFLGALRLGVHPSSRTVVYRGYQLHPVTPDIPEDPAVAEFIDGQDRLLGERFAAPYGGDVHRVMAESELELRHADGGESTLGNLAVKAYRETTGADLALEEVSLTGISVPKGPVTLMDLHDVMPHIYDFTTGKEWALKVWNAKGSDLKLVLDIFYTFEGLLPFGSPLGWLSAENAVVVWDPGIRRQRIERATPASLAVPAVKSVTIGGRPLDPQARYTVALSEGFLYAIRLANEKLQAGLDLSDIRDTGKEAWQSVVDYAIGGPRLTVAGLGVGGRSFIETFDLSLAYYAMDWDGAQLAVEVKNLGLSVSPESTLQCSTGLRDDFVAYNTDLQKWRSLPAKAVPALQPGASVTVRVPWSAQRIANGHWPVQCEVSAAKDKFPSNNLAQKVFRSAR